MKRLQLVPQGRATAPQARREPADLAAPSLDAQLRGWGNAHSPFLTMEQAAGYLLYDGPRAAATAHWYLRRHGVRLYRRGKRVLVLKTDVHALLETGQGTLDRQAAQLATRGGR